MSIYLFDTSAYTLLIGRIAMALVFLVSGWEKITGYVATKHYMEAMGGLPALLPLVILIEIAGGLATYSRDQDILGLLRLGRLHVSGGLAVPRGYCRLERAPSSPEKHRAGGRVLILAVHGPGQISVDHFIKRRRGRFQPA